MGLCVTLWRDKNDTTGITFCLDESKMFTSSFPRSRSTWECAFLRGAFVIWFCGCFCFCCLGICVCVAPKKEKAADRRNVTLTMYCCCCVLRPQTNTHTHIQHQHTTHTPLLPHSLHFPLFLSGVISFFNKVRRGDGYIYTFFCDLVIKQKITAISFLNGLRFFAMTRSKDNLDVMMMTQAFFKYKSH